MSRPTGPFRPTLPAAALLRGDAAAPPPPPPRLLVASLPPSTEAPAAVPGDALAAAAAAAQAAMAARAGDDDDHDHDDHDDHDGDSAELLAASLVKQVVQIGVEAYGDSNRQRRRFPKTPLGTPVAKEALEDTDSESSGSSSPAPARGTTAAPADALQDETSGQSRAPPQSRHGPREVRGTPAAGTVVLKAALARRRSRRVPGEAARVGGDEGADGDESDDARQEHVWFNSPLNSSHPITPYSEVYGMHPRFFIFDEAGNKVSAQHEEMDALQRYVARQYQQQQQQRVLQFYLQAAQAHRLQQQFFWQQSTDCKAFAAEDYWGRSGIYGASLAGMAGVYDSYAGDGGPLYPTPRPLYDSYAGGAPVGVAVRGGRSAAVTAGGAVGAPPAARHVAVGGAGAPRPR